MSYILSGINIQNIAEYNASNTYKKYDIIDFQITGGASVSPSYTGNGQTGLSFWFNNDLLSNFQLNTKFDVTGWNNLVSGSGNLVQTGILVNSNPYVDFNENYINLLGDDTLSGTGFSSNSRTLIMLVELSGVTFTDQTQKIFHFGTNPDAYNLTSGFLKLSGVGGNSSESKLILDNVIFDAVGPIYQNKNIFTVVQNYVSGPSTNSLNSLKLRQNGSIVGTITGGFHSNWTGDKFLIGNNTGAQDIKYYEIIHFTGVLSNSDILKYEKYLYEKYFDNTRLYFAKADVPAAYQFNPLTFNGQNYWTQDIDDLFDFSYGSSASFSANLSPLYMGDGYKTNVAQTINTLNTKFVLNYDGLTDKEAKCLITYFENTPETAKKSYYEGYEGVVLDLFKPYKRNAELYFKSIDHTTPYNDINNIKIEAESLYDSSLDYRGMLVQLDGQNIRTYTSTVSSINYNDVFYYNSDNFNQRGYYFFTGTGYNPASSGPTGPTYIIPPANSPTGNQSHFTKNFYFKGDIQYETPSTIRLLNNEMKNSTIEYDKDGINYNLLELTVNFTKRSNSEARAILKFLDTKAGYKTFEYLLPQPYNKTINVYCPEWSHTYNFLDNNDISIKLIEFKNPFDPVTDFNTVIQFVQ